MTLIQSPSPPLSLRILTHNIRYAATSPLRGEPPWPTRLPRLLSSLRFHTHHIPPAIICLQEALHSQLLAILSGLHTPHRSSPPGHLDWAFIGVGRDDGADAGEFSPILYRPAVFSLLSTRTLWLSETPRIPGSKSWDAALPRILTVGVFQHRVSKRRIVVMNTHLDDRGVRSRTEAAKMILAEVRACQKAEKGPGTVPVPVVLAGDFNSEVEGGAYKVLTGEESPMVDLRELVQERERYGHENTYTGFGYEDEKRPTRIDFLFVSRRRIAQAAEGERPGLEEVGGGGGGRCEEGDGDGEGTWTVDGYGVLENRFEDGVYVSDHRAVAGDMTLL